jgi:hypothetical protein
VSRGAVGARANEEIEGRFGRSDPFKAAKERPVMAQPARSACVRFRARSARSWDRSGRSAKGVEGGPSQIVSKGRIPALPKGVREWQDSTSSGRCVAFPMIPSDLALRRNAGGDAHLDVVVF